MSTKDNAGVWYPAREGIQRNKLADAQQGFFHWLLMLAFSVCTRMMKTCGPQPPLSERCHKKGKYVPIHTHDEDVDARNLPGGQRQLGVYRKLAGDRTRPAADDPEEEEVRPAGLPAKWKGGWPDGHAANKQSGIWMHKVHALCLMVQLRATKYAMSRMTEDDRVQDEGQAPSGTPKTPKAGYSAGSKQHKRWQLWPIVTGLALMAVCRTSTMTDRDEWRFPHPPTLATPWRHDPVSLLKGEECMDKYMLQCYEDTPGRAQVSVINDEVSRCGKWGSVATCPFETPAHLLMVAGEDEVKEPTPAVAVTADAATQTEEEAVAADVSTQTGDQGGSPTSDGGYTPSPPYSSTSDEEDQAAAPGCQVDCRGCLGCYSDVSDDEEVTQQATNQHPSDEEQRTEIRTPCLVGYRTWKTVVRTLSPPRTIAKGTTAARVCTQPAQVQERRCQTAALSMVTKPDSGAASAPA
jgi:hypothetical protein